MQEWIYRALRTFGQAALGYLAANLLATVTNLDLSNHSAFANTLLGLFAAAVAAGLAAIMNLSKNETEEKPAENWEITEESTDDGNETF